MSVSPLVHAVSPYPKNPTSASKSRLPASSLPRNGDATTTAPLVDLAEQLNAAERSKYVKGKKLGEGTYANVYLGHLKTDPSQKVAIKKIKVQQAYLEGMAPDAVRELKALQELSHPNIIALLAVFSSKDQNLNLVLEFLPLGDLEMLIKDVDGVRYGAADIKAWMGMLLRGVWFCHANFVLHRDIKPNNLLIAADGVVKLGDFGLARSFADPYRVMSTSVITRWYRPPELLFGAKHYSGAVDIWSVGMVMAELILRAPFLPGDTELHQITLIQDRIGGMGEDNWPGVSRLPEHVPVPLDTPKPVLGRDHYMSIFGTAGAEGVELLMGMCVLDPRKRITAEECLEHSYWSSEPRATKNEELPKKGGGIEKVGEDLAQKPGRLADEGNGVARKLFH